MVNVTGVQIDNTYSAPNSALLAAQEAASPALLLAREVWADVYNQSDLAVLSVTDIGLLGWIASLIWPKHCCLFFHL